MPHVPHKAPFEQGWDGSQAWPMLARGAVATASSPQDVISSKLEVSMMDILMRRRGASDVPARKSADCCHQNRSCEQTLPAV